jgi:hypothetical protein
MYLLKRAITSTRCAGIGSLHRYATTNKAAAAAATAANTQRLVKSDMKDEYGDMDSSGETYMTTNFQLESGQVLKEAHVRCISEALGAYSSLSMLSFCRVHSSF